VRDRREREIGKSERESEEHFIMCPFFVLGAVSQNTNDSVSDIPLPKSDLPITTFVTHTTNRRRNRLIVEHFYFRPR